MPEKDLYADYEKFQEIRASAKSEEAALKKAMTCHNVVNCPLLKGPMDKKILGGYVLFPELHVYLGVGGTKKHQLLKFKVCPI